MGVSPLRCHAFLHFNVEFCCFICETDYFTKSFNNFFYLLQLASTSLSAPTQCPLSPKLLLNPFWMSISLLPSLCFTRLCSAKKYLDIKMGAGNLPHFLCGPYFELKIWGTAKYSLKLQFRKSKAYWLARSLVGGWSLVSSLSLMRKESDKTF